ncbi:pectinesterase inhibitor 10 isoform X2 [Ricinus communis]|uniref:pectinesterase inhibitor 10 isoform X2 n=1 Tax=Ricinus communis TaxID=3988 RepID=UPI00201A6EDA|nr:pectinesterase inhibitor 10 isoform X2 [Ricinus communis]
MAALLLGHALLIAILILHFPTYINSSPPTAPLPSNTNTQYIRTTCNYTTYPRLCYHSLSIYASKIKTNPKLLANTALNITFKATESTSRLMKKMSRIHGLNPGVAAALVDCMEVVGDSVYELQRSIGEMGHASGANFYGVMEDIQTWDLDSIFWFRFAIYVELYFLPVPSSDEVSYLRLDYKCGIVTREVILYSFHIG